MSKVAFTARESGEPMTGGTVATGDGETLDVAAALEEGNGTITVDADSPTALALDAFPGVKRTTVPDNERGSEAGAKSGSSRRKA
jgi:hypothetical protein